VRAETGGFYVEPTVFDDVANGMKIAREEIFGPVMSIIRFKTEAEAVQMANASAYGLQASVWSDNVNRAHRVARALRAGTVHVNQYDEDDITVPFRRLQAKRQRPRQEPARLRQVHRAEDHLAAHRRQPRLSPP
jgi:acyl-CoA reductase-like NAD-dependent aldehyde dehydrogenase